MPNDHNSLSHRLEALETKIAFQDVTIEELNKMVMLLQQKITKLTAQLHMFSEKMQTMYETLATQSEEIPPHY